MTKTFHRRAARVCLALILVLPAQHSLAAGFYLTEIGTPGSLGTAGAANPTNNFGADTAWANPAGMTGVKQDTLMAGFQALVPFARFDSSLAAEVPSGTPVRGNDGGNAGEWAPVPSFFYVNKLSDRASAGIAVTGVMGGGIDYGDDFVGRYSTISAMLQGLGITPSFGYKVNDRLSLGVGASIIYTLFEQDIAIRDLGGLPPTPPFPAPTPATDGEVNIEEATDWGVQGVFGLQYQLTDRLLLGAVYRSEFDAELEGDVKFKRLPIPDGDVDVDWTNPQWLDVGIRYKLNEDLALAVNAGWQEWSEFSANTLAVDISGTPKVVNLDRNFDDTWYVGAAIGERHVSPKGVRFWTIGASYDSSPVDDDDRTLDLPFDEMVKLSAAWGLEGAGNLDYSIGGTLAWLGDGKVDQTSQGVRVKGEFDTNLLVILGATLRYEF